MSNKYAAFGTKLYRGTSGAGTLIPGAKDFSGPGLSADTVDVTTHDSPGAFEEHVVSILRTGEVTFAIEYDPVDASHKNAAGGLVADLVGRASTTYTLVFPDSGNTEWVFTAFVTGFAPTAPVDGDLTADITMKVTGQPTLA